MEKFNNWITFSLISFFLWGFWGMLPKLTTNYMHPKSAIIYETLGCIIGGLIIFIAIGFKPEAHPKGILFAMLTGIFGLFGAFTFLFAMSKGKASVVVTMTALYPILTILLSYFILHETVTLKQGIGIVFALIAMVLFAA